MFELLHKLGNNQIGNGEYFSFSQIASTKNHSNTHQFPSVYRSASIVNRVNTNLSNFDLPEMNIVFVSNLTKYIFGTIQSNLDVKCKFPTVLSFRKNEKQISLIIMASTAGATRELKYFQMQPATKYTPTLDTK